MDISICFADFPTQAIGDTTRAYRQLGIGYANLGALLMATGTRTTPTAVAHWRRDHLADDRYVVQALGRAGRHRRSVRRLARNKDAHTRVMRKHAAATDAIRTVHPIDKDVQQHAAAAWDGVLKLGMKYGWRNAQASVLAPTGTIGFMMDCDTTGIEPDFSLVKFKKLVGGGRCRS
jgi:ribonucleoside-diphosphate reductase alpha chain